MLFHTGEENWMQCDHCERWVHYECTGLSDKDLKHLQDNEELPYVCLACADEEYSD